MPAYFIVTEDPIDGFDLFGNGEALAFASDLLERLASEAGVRTLMDFFSMEPEEVETLFGMLGLDGTGTEVLPEDEGDQPAPSAPDTVPELDEAPPEVWFPARDGLTTVEALIKAVEALPETANEETDTPPSQAILADLRQFETILTNLATEGIRWHLMVDI